MHAARRWTVHRQRAHLMPIPFRDQDEIEDLGSARGLPATGGGCRAAGLPGSALPDQRPRRASGIHVQPGEHTERLPLAAQRPPAFGAEKVDRLLTGDMLAGATARPLSRFADAERALCPGPPRFGAGRPGHGWRGDNRVLNPSRHTRLWRCMRPATAIPSMSSGFRNRRRGLGRAPALSRASRSGAAT